MPAAAWNHGNLNPFIVSILRDYEAEHRSQWLAMGIALG